MVNWRDGVDVGGGDVGGGDAKVVVVVAADADPIDDVAAAAGAGAADPVDDVAVADAGAGGAD